MAKRIYQVGEPCDVCGTPTVQGKDGNGYCKPCYIAWKNRTEGLKPAVKGYHPNSTSNVAYKPVLDATGLSDVVTELININGKLTIIIGLLQPPKKSDLPPDFPI